MNKETLLLNRVEAKKAEMQAFVSEQVTQNNPYPESFDSAYSAALSNQCWAVQDTGLELTYLEVDRLHAALSDKLKSGEPFGPIEQAALEYLTIVTDTAGVVETLVNLECRFETCPLSYPRRIDDFVNGLRFGVTFERSIFRYAEVQNVVLLDKNFEALGNGASLINFCKISGRLSFTLKILSDHVDNQLPELLPAMKVMVGQPKEFGGRHTFDMQDIKVLSTVTQ